MRNKTIFRMVLALLAAGLVFCGTAAASFVPASSPRIKTMGRWIPADNGSLYAGRGGVVVSTQFEGTGVQVQMYSDSQGDCWWLKKLDDGPLIRFKVQMGMNVLFQNLPMGKHTLFMIRDTEGMRGVTILRGFYFIGESETPAVSVPTAVQGNANHSGTAARTGKPTHNKTVGKKTVSKKNANAPVTPPVQKAPRRRSIEIIGDSVAAGAFIYPEGDYFQRESSYLAFGPRLAQKEPRWSNQMDDPDLVILAYGENDFNDEVNRPSDAYFKEQYKELVLKLRQFRPNSVIFCMTPSNIVTSRRSVPGMGGAVAELRAAGDTNVYFVDLNARGPLLGPSDTLDGVHPLASGHDKIAAVLGWN